MNEQLEVIKAQADAQIEVIDRQAQQEAVRSRQECVRTAMEALRENRSTQPHNVAKDITPEAIIAYAEKIEAYISGS